MNPESNPALLASVVIVSWNARRYLEECLTSLRAVRDIPLEILVVDNASSDGSPEMVQEKFPEVQLFQTGANLGFAKGNNFAIPRCRGKYICLINSDVNVRPGSLQAVLEFMDANPDVGMAGPPWLTAELKVRRSCMRFPTVWNNFCRATAIDCIFKSVGGLLMTDFSHEETADVEALNGWFWVVRREALAQVGLLDERFFMYGEDLDWSYRFAQAGWRRVFVAGPGSIHYGGSSSAVAPVRFYIEMQKANFQYFEKHHSTLACYAIYGTTALHELVRITGYSLAYLLWPAKRRTASLMIERGFATLRWLIGFRYRQRSFSSPAPVAELRES
ncbi:MAG TPA: glycosyltransferase family 2 protein [Terriglobales bacterium]